MRKFVRALINKDNQYLLINENREQSTWNFPGGKVEINESPVEACKREVFEETNLIIDKLTLLLKLNINGWEGYYYMAHNYHGNVILKEAKSKKYQYVSLEHFSNFNYYISLIQESIQEKSLYE